MNDENTTYGELAALIGKQLDENDPAHADYKRKRDELNAAMTAEQELWKKQNARYAELQAQGLSDKESESIMRAEGLLDAK